MGWRLAEEIAWARPERPGPEWWTLLDIAQDARDETRQSMCGQEYLMARGKCSRATLYRRLEKLQKAGLIVTVRKAAPRTRAIYEIPELHTGLTVVETCTGLTNAETRSPVDNPPTGLTNAETRSGTNESQNGGQRVSKSGQRVSLTLRHTPSDTPSLTPSDVSPVVTTSVEGNRLSTGQVHDLDDWLPPRGRHARKDTST